MQLIFCSCPTVCLLPGRDGDHPHGASGAVHALPETAVRQLAAAVNPPPGCVLGGSPAGSHVSGGQSNTKGVHTVFVWERCLHGCVDK